MKATNVVSKAASITAMNVATSKLADLLSQESEAVKEAQLNIKHVVDAKESGVEYLESVIAGKVMKLRYTDIMSSLIFIEKEARAEATEFDFIPKHLTNIVEALVQLVESKSSVESVSLLASACNTLIQDTKEASPDSPVEEVLAEESEALEASPESLEVEADIESAEEPKEEVVEEVEDIPASIASSDSTETTQEASQEVESVEEVEEELTDEEVQEVREAIDACEEVEDVGVTVEEVVSAVAPKATRKRSAPAVEDINEVVDVPVDGFGDALLEEANGNASSASPAVLEEEDKPVRTSDEAPKATRRRRPDSVTSESGLAGFVRNSGDEAWDDVLPK